MSIDIVVLALLHMILFGIALFGFISDLRARYSSSGFHASVTRGHLSIGYLTVSFGVISSLYYATVDVAETLNGFKTLVIWVDFLLAFYVTMISERLRNLNLRIYQWLKKIEE